MTGLLNIPGVIELETEDEPHHYVIHAKSEKPVGKACNLGCNLRRNGTKPLDINDVPHHGKATLIKFRRQQFSCPGCKNEEGEVVGNDAISEILPFKEPGFLMTKRLVLWMARQAMRRTFAEIGRDAAVNPKSVAKAFDAYTSVEIAKLRDSQAKPTASTSVSAIAVGLPVVTVQANPQAAAMAR